MPRIVTEPEAVENVQCPIRVLTSRIVAGREVADGGRSVDGRNTRRTRARRWERATDPRGAALRRPLAAGEGTVMNRAGGELMKMPAETNSRSNVGLPAHPERGCGHPIESRAHCSVTAPSPRFRR